MTLIETARHHAERAHSGQTRKGRAGLPYVTHCAEVARLVTLWHGNEAEVAAAWLHDVVEDCGVPASEIERAFGAEVASLVAELTDDKSLPKAERKRLQVERAAGKSPSASRITLADKIANVASLAEDPPVDWDVERLRAYVDWAEAVVVRLSGLPDEGTQLFSTTATASRAAIEARGGSQG